MADAATPQDSPKKSGSKLIIFVLLGVLLAGGGAGGAWFLLGRGQSDAHAPAQAKKSVKKPLFTTLEPFTVNLQDARGERFAQVGITLQFEDPGVEGTIKDHLPAVRNDILLLISSKQIEELLTVEGKRKLADEIRLRTGRAMGVDLPDPGAAHGAGAVRGKHEEENPIRDVLFSQFIVQ